MKKRKSSSPTSPGSPTSLSVPLLKGPRVFYEPDATLDISRDNAEGFIILLSDGKENAKGVVKDSVRNSRDVIEAGDITLAFMAITDGNVIDACFGNSPAGGIKFKGSDYAVKTAGKAKALVRDAVEESSPSMSDRVKLLTVKTYKECFQIVVKFNNELSKNSFLSWCFKSKQIRKNAEKALENCFQELVQLFDSIESEKRY